MARPPVPLAAARDMWDRQSVAIQGSDSAHDATVKKLLGESADEILARPTAYPQLLSEQIAAAFEAGKTCRIKVPAARILAYRTSAGTACAIVTELRTGATDGATDHLKLRTPPNWLDCLQLSTCDP